jgi:flagellar protein FlaG
MGINGVGQGRPSSLELVNKNTDTTNNNGQNTLQEKTKTVDFKVNASKETMDSGVNEEDLKKAVDKLNKFLEDEQTHAVYEVHEKLNDVMIKIVDNNTKQVLLEVPPRKILDMVAKMMEMVGLLVDKRA